jgi:SET domain-containing protein
MQKRAYAKFRIARTGDKGWGAVLQAPVKEHDLIIEYVGEVIDQHEVRTFCC